MKDSTVGLIKYAQCFDYSLLHINMKQRVHSLKEQTSLETKELIWITIEGQMLGHHHTKAIFPSSRTQAASPLTTHTHTHKSGDST